MKSLAKKICTLLLCLSFIASQTAFAQEATSTPAALAEDALTAPTQAVSIDASTTPSAAIDLQGPIAPIQEATNIQNVATSSILENTTNPETASSTDATAVAVATGSSTPQSQPVVGATGTTTNTQALVTQDASLDVVAEHVEVPTDPTPTPVVPERLAGVPLKEIEEAPTFSFALTGRHIPSKRKVTDASGDVVREDSVTTVLAPQVDNADGKVTVSGQCGDVYYVVLLYKNADDYTNDPRSYIVNRAYPCVNNSYTYSIDELPSTIPNGSYYLLVGQEGKTGTWTPITSLTEITINRNQ